MRNMSEWTKLVLQINSIIPEKNVLKLTFFSILLTIFIAIIKYIIYNLNYFVLKTMAGNTLHDA